MAASGPAGTAGPLLADQDPLDALDEPAEDGIPAPLDATTSRHR